MPVTKNGNVIANLEDFFHAVGDIDNTAALRFQLAYDAEQGFGFGIGQRIGRFIHNDDFRLKAQHFGDFNHLLVTDGKIAHQLVAFKAQVKFSQQFIRFGIHGFPVNFAKAINKLTTEENVFGNGQLRDQVQFLMDNPNPGFLGRFRPGKCRFFPQP